jgi:C-methyltransferase C-terminal domain/Putative zinc binding domain/Methyltransferase domain
MICRVCRSDNLELLLDLGTQCLAGQFPKIGEPDPPSFPLELGRCLTCGMVQLMRAVNPDIQFTNYFYRSGVTETMRNHLQGIAKEALERHPSATYALDIGGNDDELLMHLGASLWRYSIDPCDVGRKDSISHHLGFFPWDCPSNWKNFDLIFTIACFYDSVDPVAFAQAVRERLAPHGLWCVEVASLQAMMEQVAYDAICHEHVLYFGVESLIDVCTRAGLAINHLDFNNCNGGSMRAWCNRDQPGPVHITAPYRSVDHKDQWDNFAMRVVKHKRDLIHYLRDCSRADKTVHLLGASTKANTMLQYCGITTDLVQAASDRDPRKAGRQTPGTHIPIITEEESRACEPDVYIVGPRHFLRPEIIEREKAFLDRGGELVVPLPTLEVVKR